MDDINFKRGIKKKLPLNFATSKPGVDLLNKILKSLNSVLVNFCLERDINLTTAQQAVEQSLTGDLKTLALAEGNRVLMLHTNGLLKYEPGHAETQIRKRKKGKKQKIIAAQEFSEGIFDLTSLTFNGQASLQDESKKIMCELLEDLAVKISDLVQSRRKDNITQNDITGAVEQLLPEELSRHAIDEGFRVLFLHQNGVLEARSKSVAKTEMPKRARKRKRSQLVETTPRAKRRKRSTSRKTSLKKPPKRTSRPKKKTQKSSKRRYRKRSISKDETLAGAKRRRKSSAKSPRTTKSIKVSKFEKSESPSISKKEIRKSSKRRSSKRSISKDETFTVTKRRRKSSAKSPRSVSPKTVRKISKKQPTKKKTVSKKETTREISSVVKREIKSGVKKLNKSYKQELSTAGEELISQCLYNLLSELCDTMKKDKISSIGPMEVRRAVLKIFPSELAESAIAEMSRVLMTT